MSTIIYINGVVRTTDFPFNSLEVIREAGTKNSLMSLDIIDITEFPIEGDLVELWEDGVLLFSGLILDDEKISPVPLLQGQMSVIDWYDMLMQRYVRSTLKNKSTFDLIQEIVQTRVNSDDLRLLFQFEAGSGTSIVDYSQHTNTGVINGSGFAWDTSNFALALDGSDGTFISVPDDDTLDLTSLLSICIEFEIDTLNETILSKDNSSGDRPYRIAIDGGGNVVFTVADSGGEFSISTSDAPISVSTKHTIVCTFDQTSGIGVIYVDGLENTSGALTTNALVDSTGDLIIGAIGATIDAGFLDILALQGMWLAHSTATPEPNFDGKFYRISMYAKVLDAVEARRYHIDTLEVKAPERLILESTTTFDRIAFSFQYPAECLDIITKRLGLSWKIDEHAFLHLLSRESGSPVQVFEEDNGTILSDSLSIQTSIAEVRNAIYVRGGIYLGDWRSDKLETNGTDNVFALPYKYTEFELFSDNVALHSFAQSMYLMNDSSGNLADAFSANVLTAANLTYSQTGKVGDAITFNGTSSSARKASATHDTGDATHSMTAWIKPTTHDATERIICGFGNFAAGHSNISLILSGGTYYLRQNFGDGIVNDTDVGDLTDGAFHLVGMSYDSALPSNDKLRIYLDGQLQATIAVGTAPDIDAGVVEIGGNNGSNVFAGDIDEVTFFQWALSDQEHESVYNLNNTSAISGFLLRSGIEFIDDEAGAFDGFYNFGEKNYKFATAPTTGITLYTTGMPNIPVQALRTNAASMAAYERRELQIKDQSIETLEGARSRANAEVARRKDPTEIIKFQTHTSGVNPGDLITLIAPSFAVPSKNYFVNRVVLRAWLPTTQNSKKFIYEIHCTNTINKDWIDFLRDSFERGKDKLDPAEGEAIADIVDHNEEISFQDAHVVKTATAHAEEISFQDAHTPTVLASGAYVWSNDAGTTPDKLRWNLGDWG